MNRERLRELKEEHLRSFKRVFSFLELFQKHLIARRSGIAFDRHLAVLCLLRSERKGGWPICVRVLLALDDRVGEGHIFVFKLWKMVFLRGALRSFRLRRGRYLIFKVFNLNAPEDALPYKILSLYHVYFPLMVVVLLLFFRLLVHFFN
jgi:hypothetical protein